MDDATVHDLWSTSSTDLVQILCMIHPLFKLMLYYSELNGTRRSGVVNVVIFEEEDFIRFSQF